MEMKNIERWLEKGVYIGGVCFFTLGGVGLTWLVAGTDAETVDRVSVGVFLLALLMGWLGMDLRERLSGPAKHKHSRTFIRFYGVVLCVMGVVLFIAAVWMSVVLGVVNYQIGIFLLIYAYIGLVAVSGGVKCLGGDVSESCV